MVEVVAEPVVDAVADQAVAAAVTPAPATIAGGAAAPASDQAVTPQADWPTDWREKLAGDDKEYLKQLGRYASPQDVAKKARSLEQKLSSGDYLKPYPALGTPEEQAIWRKEGGIPNTPEEYVTGLKMADGLVAGEADKPLLNNFAKTAREMNLTPDQFGKLSTWFFTQQDAARAAQSDADEAFRSEARMALGAEYGPAVKRELSIVQNFLNTHLPEEARIELLAARGASGRVVGDNPIIIKALSALAHSAFPLETQLPSGTSDVGKAAGDRLNEIKSLMANSNSEYWHGPKSSGIQAEYMKLLEGLEAYKARVA